MLPIRQSMIDQLDTCVRRHASGRMYRLLRHPLESIRRSLYFRTRTDNALLAKGKTARLFFGDTIHVTVPPAEELWLTGLYLDQAEINLARYLILSLNNGDVFFDVGAHFGYFSMLAARLVASEGAVYAFDPSPAVLPSLRKSIRQTPGIELIDKAICECSQMVEMHVGPAMYAANSTINPADLTSAGFESLDRFEKVMVEGITLDWFCQSRGIVPTFIKVDVEGAEEQMLRGSRWLLENHNVSVVMEIWFQTFTSNYRQSLEFLRELGYWPNAILKDGSLVALDYESLTEHGRNICSDPAFPNGLDNVLFRKRP